MTPKRLITVGLILLALPFVIALVSSGIFIPLGLIALALGLGLYGFERVRNQLLGTTDA